MSLNDRLLDPNNRNPLFQRIMRLSDTAFARPLRKKVLEARTVVGTLTGGSVIAEMLETPLNPRRAKSKSAFKYCIGSYGGNIEVWDSPSSERMIMITNGERGSKRRVLYIFPVRKINGIWVEWKETIEK